MSKMYLQVFSDRLLICQEEKKKPNKPNIGKF